MKISKSHREKANKTKSLCHKNFLLRWLFGILSIFPSFFLFQRIIKIRKTNLQQFLAIEWIHWIINHLQFIFDYLEKLLTRQKYIDRKWHNRNTQIELIYFIDFLRNRYISLSHSVSLTLSIKWWFNDLISEFYLWWKLLFGALYSHSKNVHKYLSAINFPRRSSDASLSFSYFVRNGSISKIICCFAV